MLMFSSCRIKNSHSKVLLNNFQATFLVIDSFFFLQIRRLLDRHLIEMHGDRLVQRRMTRLHFIIELHSLGV